MYVAIQGTTDGCSTKASVETLCIECSYKLMEFSFGASMGKTVATYIIKYGST